MGAEMESSAQVVMSSSEGKADVLETAQQGVAVAEHVLPWDAPCREAVGEEPAPVTAGGAVLEAVKSAEPGDVQSGGCPTGGVRQPPDSTARTRVEAAPTRAYTEILARADG
jgi:hypothetical protein